MTENILNAVQDDAVVQLAYNLVVDGEEIESEVLEYLHGHQNIIPGLENALTGLEVGDSKEVLVLAEDAYGEFDPEAVVLVTRKSFPRILTSAWANPCTCATRTGTSLPAWQPRLPTKTWSWT